MNKYWNYTSFGIPDEYFTRGKVPMTKEEVRSVVMGKLRLRENHILVDMGSGTGSVTIEGALKLPKGKVYSIEYKEEALKLLEININKFGLTNIEVLKGRGKEQLQKIPYFDRIFIGGSGKELSWIINYAFEHLSYEGRIVITAITLETLTEAFYTLKTTGFKELETISIGVSKGRFTGNYTLMQTENTVYILSGSKL